MAFMNQENSDKRLLVIIKNKDIAGHIHKVPLNDQLKKILFLSVLTASGSKQSECIFSRSVQIQIVCEQSCPLRSSGCQVLLSLAAVRQRQLPPQKPTDKS